VRAVGRSKPPTEAFVDVYDEHIWDVYGFLAYRLGSRPDAEDLTQQTFERALRAWARFDPAKASPKTWLLAIARNLLIDHHRYSAVRPEDPADDEVLEAHSDHNAGPAPDLGLSPALASGLAALSDRDREVVGLRYGGDLTGPEIADELGLTLANVQQILSRSLRRLREHVGSPERARSGSV